MKISSKVKTIVAITLLTLGLGLIPTGFVLGEVIQGEIDKGIADEVSVPSKHSSEFDEWISNDYEDAPKMYATFNLWNLTNLDEFIAGDKPVFEEIGPFVFRKFDRKYDIDFSDDNDEVSYREYSNYVQVYGDDISKVNITNVNPAYLGAIETAGGTTLDLIKFALPMVLSEVKETFVEEYLAALPETLTDPMVKVAIVFFGYILPGLNEIPQSELPWPFDTPENPFYPEPDFPSMPELFNFSNALPAEAVFFEKWANDYFPNTNHFVPHNETLGYNFDRALLIPFKIDASPQEMANQRVNEEGSEHNIGVDIDGLDPYNYPGSETDLNISMHELNDTKSGITDPLLGDMIYRTNVGGSGLTQEQCQELWNKSNPYSLTGFDYEKTKVWFNALDEDIESCQTLKDTFGVNDTQLNLILDWLNVSIHTWAKNVQEWTLNDWNSGFITTRTAKEWLFTANDTAVYNHQIYYDRDTNLALIGFVDNCHNKMKPEEADVPKLTIKTGRDDISEVGQVIEYNGQEEIYIWAEPIDVEGTLGTQFAPGVSEEDDLKVFNTDLMRVVELEYDEPAEIYDIKLLQFEMSEDTFSPDPVYFMNTEGIINLATVEKYHKAPVRITRPHLLGTPLSVQKSVIGMAPNSHDHKTYVNVEPITGIVMDAAVRAQVNFEVKSDEMYYPNISRIIMPVVWFEVGGEIPEDLAEDFKELVYGAIELREMIPMIFLGTGIGLCVPGAILLTVQIATREGLKKLLRRKGR